MSSINTLWHKRLPEFEAYDAITFAVVPRYKTSELSGDEWRQHVEVTFWFKGVAVGAWSARDMAAAAMMLGAKLLDASPIPAGVRAREDALCSQPGCDARPTRRFLLKELFSDRGEKLDPADRGGQNYFRQFCDKHATRGDCDREDSDANYTKLPL